MDGQEGRRGDVLLGEPFETIHLVGFLVVFGGVGLISWEHATMERKD